MTAGGPGLNTSKDLARVVCWKGELTRKAQISPFTVSRIEKGMPCRMETKRKIIPALGWKVSDKDRVFFESD